MSIPLPFVLLFGLLCTVISLTIANQVKRFFPQSSKDMLNKNSPDRHGMPDHQDVLRRITTLYELTTNVGSQVSRHSDRINEIADTFEQPEDVGPMLVLTARKLLVSANLKLQAELDEAQKEIQLQRDQINSCLHESRTDALTCLPNRRALDQELSRVVAQNRANGQEFSLMIIDIDHFKRINDQYGHLVGDQALKSFSRFLTSTLRESDFVARYGGEEFVVILQKTAIAEACLEAERVRAAIEATLHKVGALEIAIKSSIGVKEILAGETENHLFQMADKALYAAKNSGRNCCFYHDGTTCHRIPDPRDLASTDQSFDVVRI